MSVSAPTKATAGFGWDAVEMQQTSRRADPQMCEEALVADSSGLFAVVDGGECGGDEVWTLRGQPTSAGRFAALTVADALARVPAGRDPKLVINAVSAVLERSVRAQRPDIDPLERPSCSVSVFDPALGALYWVGGCWHGVVSSSGWVDARRDRALFDDVICDARLAALESAVAAGRPWEPSRGLPDPSERLVATLLQQRRGLINAPGRFGIGGINGLTVPREHLHLRLLESEDCEVVLASDGYPSVNVGEDFSVASAEAHLARLLAEDPACTGPLAGVRGVALGEASFDDRSWLRVARTAR